MISGTALHQIMLRTNHNVKRNKFPASSSAFEVAAKFDERPLEASWNCSVFDSTSELASLASEALSRI